VGVGQPPSNGPPRSADGRRRFASEGSLSGGDEDETVFDSLEPATPALPVVPVVPDSEATMDEMLDKTDERITFSHGSPPIAFPETETDPDLITLDDARPGNRASRRKMRRAPTPIQEQVPDETCAYEETLIGRRPARPAHDRIGTVIAGRYQLVGVLGEGGMGTVFEASHIDLGKRVAIKILAGVFAGNEEASARFLREARAASAVESEHIAQVFDVGEDINVGHYMVMELLKGNDLSARLERGGRLRSEEAAGIALQISRALERAHEAGIVHRDLKPGNIFLTAADDGSVRVKVLDFGIAKLVREAQGSRGGITQRGTALGTPQYMSPEQAQGLESVNGSTDVYSLGALLHECLTGTAPYPELESYELTIVKIITTDPPRVSEFVTDVEPAMEQLIVDMMARSPADRPASFREVRERLAQIHPTLESKRLTLAPPVAPPARRAAPVRTGGGVTVERVDPARLVPTKPPIKPAPIAMVGTFAALVTIGLVLFLTHGTDEMTPGSAPLAATTVLVESAAVEAPPTGTSTTAPVPAPPVTGVVTAAPPAAALPPPQAITPAQDPASLIRDAQRGLDHGDARRATALASAATSLAPTNAEAWLTLGAAYNMAGNHDAARRAYVACAAKAKGDRVHECVELARE